MGNKRGLGTVVSFEFLNVVKSKGYKITITLLLALILAAGVIPRIISIFNSDKETIIMVNDRSVEKSYIDDIRAAFPSDRVDETAMTKEELIYFVNNNKHTYGVYFNGYDNYSYIVKNQTDSDRVKRTITSAVSTSRTVKDLQNLGLTEDEALSIATTTIEPVVISASTNNTDNYFYVYFTCFIIYFTLLLFGQLIASTTAAEKSTKVVEVLITSTSSNNLIFGKIIALGCAAMFTYLLMFLMTAIALFLNPEFWNIIKDLVFSANFSFDMVGYSLIFTVLGYLIYANIYAIIGAIVSKPEEISTVSTIPTFLLIALLIFCTQAPISGTANTMVMKVLSFIPFTSPMAMIVRICIGDVSFISIIISILILMVTNMFLIKSTSKIYKNNILNYSKVSNFKDAMKKINSKNY